MVTPKDVSRRTMAPFMWYGGKGNFAKHILPYLSTEHHTYAEPYCGAASVFWHKQKSKVEVLNDLNGDIVNLFRVFQDRNLREEFKHRIEFTLYSFDEFKLALSIVDDAAPIDRAWAFYVRQNQGWCGKCDSPGDWGRTFNAYCGMSGTANKWVKRRNTIDWWSKRLSGVQLDNRDALEFIKFWDRPDTLFYCDPPYVADTRRSKDDYDHECADSHHEELISLLLTIKGMAIVSGYKHPIYDQLVKSGWSVESVDTVSHTSRAKDKRTECIWLSPRISVQHKLL